MESRTRLNNIQEEMTALLSAMRGSGGRWRGNTRALVRWTLLIRTNNYCDIL